MCRRSPDDHFTALHVLRRVKHRAIDDQFSLADFVTRALNQSLEEPEDQMSGSLLAAASGAR